MSPSCSPAGSARRGRRALLLVAACVALGLLVTGPTAAGVASPAEVRPEPGARAAETPRRPLASTMLRRLVTRPKGRAAGFARSRFGLGWVDTDRNGCDTRNDVLRRDLDEPVLDVDGCTVTAGTLIDPYTRVTMDRLGEMAIDHVVGLRDAWRQGARRWTWQKRVRLANDPLNLLAVDSVAMRGRRGADAGRWLPENTTFRCQFVARQVALKATYGLTVTPRERAQFATVLRTCPGQRTPDPSERPSVAPMPLSG